MNRTTVDETEYNEACESLGYYLSEWGASFDQAEFARCFGIFDAVLEERDNLRSKVERQAETIRHQDLKIMRLEQR